MHNRHTDIVSSSLHCYKDNLGYIAVNDDVMFIAVIH